ncbi:LLM class flavin-dependent oxidoreductase [Amycolatopsis azurea]|uniref:Alkanesulfonate monooxygenase n=1 Tax=Amycolatopsis azurea DSM 43854 TaxID=1238180 RepID=M2QB63_9PSEU|nr:LLM class flavin-dependent oxidoreductase [Amycolatopsis azurea]EMD29285.1 Alkanesulfonate monooxygenase [Amycolatopsis azurea DSM 43854]OOC01884.1 alkanesulfonate monooxygenase [Amycolatopsis azurea DSM 43854]
MTVDVYWRIGMGGDHASLRTPKIRNRGDWGGLGPGNIAPALRDGEPDGYAYIDHAAAVAKASEAAGFLGGLLPSFPGTEDPWALSAALAKETSTYRFMVAFQPGFLHPLQAARMSASLQRATGGRLVYNIISGGGGPAQLWWGDKVDHDDRYARTSEFLHVLKGVWRGEPYDFDGRFFSARGASLPEHLVGEPFPEIYFSGSSAAAVNAAGLHSDYYLSWLEPFADLERKFDGVRAHAAKLGRTPKFAVRIDILARHTEEAAWAEIEKGWRHVDPEIANRQAQGDSVGAGRIKGWVPSTITGYRDVEVQPNVWAGFSLLRGGPAFGLVGSYAQVAERLDQLLDLGVDAFILAGNPHLEEAYRVGEEVLPLLGRSRFTRPTTLRAPASVA